MVVMSRGEEIWKGHKDELTIVAQGQRAYPYGAVYGRQDDIQIARRKAAMRSKRPDKSEAQKAQPPTLPHVWGEESSVTYARDVVRAFHAYLDSSPGYSLRDRAFINAWKQAMVKGKDKTTYQWLDAAVNALQTATTYNWDFREAFYMFCSIAFVRATQDALIEVYQKTKQKEAETACQYVAAMIQKAVLILSALGGIRKALDIITKGLSNRKLKVRMQRELEEGNCLSFATYSRRLEELVEWEDIEPLAQAKPGTRTSTEKEEKGDQKRGRWNERKKDQGGNRKASREPATNVQAVAAAAEQGKLKRESLEEWEKLAKSLQGKSNDEIDKATAQFKVAILDKLRPTRGKDKGFLEKVEAMWDKKAAELKQQMLLAAGNKGGQKKAPPASKQNKSEDQA